MTESLRVLFAEHSRMRKVFGELIEHLEEMGIFSEYACTEGEGRDCELSISADDMAHGLCFTHAVFMSAKNLLDELDKRGGRIQ